jgi:crossover junction endodeoxyribonuclease RuvC
VRILGIDPGSRATGWGVVELAGSRLRRIDGGVIRPPAAPLAERLAAIFAGLRAAIAASRPEAAAVESVFAARNARSALLLGHARGVALLACELGALACAEYAPMQVKSAVVGFGAAPKDQVQRMIQRLLGLDAVPPTDEADALAVAICHGHSARVLAARAVQARSPRALPGSAS